MHWGEDAISSSTLRDRLEAFLDNGVAQRLGISWKDFLEMPTYMCDLMLEVLSKRKPDLDLDDLKRSLGSS